MPSQRTWAVIVSFNPPAGFEQRVLAASEQCAGVIIVDNGSQNFDPPPSAKYVIQNADNRGIACAMNQGIAFAYKLGADYALLLDHDSKPLPNMVTRLANALVACSDKASVAVPIIRYGHPDIRCRWPHTLPNTSRVLFRFVYGQELKTPTEVDLAINSGMLVKVTDFNDVGCFDETLFIDLVDTELCLRFRRSGRKIIAVPGATLQHELGNVVQRRLFGLFKAYPTNHSASRHYFIARNRIILSRKYGTIFPSWLAYEWLGALKLFVKTMIYEPDRIAKLKAAFIGSIDGVRMTKRDHEPSKS